jgi:hypothetical protein
LRKEPGTSQEAQDFACDRYKAEYPILGKVYIYKMLVCLFRHLHVYDVPVNSDSLELFVLKESLLTTQT